MDHDPDSATQQQQQQQLLLLRQLLQGRLNDSALPSSSLSSLTAAGPSTSGALQAQARSTVEQEPQQPQEEEPQQQQQQQHQQREQQQQQQQLLQSLLAVAARINCFNNPSLSTQHLRQSGVTAEGLGNNVPLAAAVSLSSTAWTRVPTTSNSQQRLQQQQQQQPPPAPAAAGLQIDQILPWLLFLINHNNVMPSLAPSNTLPLPQPQAYNQETPASNNNNNNNNMSSVQSLLVPPHNFSEAIRLPSATRAVQPSSSSLCFHHQGGATRETNQSSAPPQNNNNNPSIPSRVFLAAPYDAPPVRPESAIHSNNNNNDNINNNVLSSLSTNNQNNNDSNVYDAAVDDDFVKIMANNKRKYTHEAFPHKLHRIVTQLEAEGKHHVVSFLKEGGIWVQDRQTFVNEIMPLYFRAQGWSSFRRQLFSYRFPALPPSERRKGAFTNPLFLRDKPELCNKIQRDDKHDKKHRGVKLSSSST
ncbi:hypothetical protein ACA910_014792 [Epithemia clementina (nom. ined.)]